MAGWHHRLNRHEFEQTQGDSEGKGSLACWSPWGRKESDTTERIDNKFILTTECFLELGWCVVLSKTKYLFKNFYFFNWRIISLQNCDVFAVHQFESAIVYMCPLHPELPSHLPPHPIPPNGPLALALHALLHISNSTLALCFTYGNVYVSVLFSQVIPSLLPLSPKICSLYPTCRAAWETQT